MFEAVVYLHDGVSILCIRTLFGLFDEVGYLFEYGSYVIVLDENSSRKVQRHRGEVQHAFDTGIDDRNNQVGGDCSGAGEDDDLDVELLDLMLEVSHVEAGDIVYDLADLYKGEHCIDLAFFLCRELAGKYDKYAVSSAFRERVIKKDLLARIVKDVDALIGEKSARRYRQ